VFTIAVNEVSSKNSQISRSLINFNFQGVLSGLELTFQIPVLFREFKDLHEPGERKKQSGETTLKFWGPTWKFSEIQWATFPPLLLITYPILYITMIFWHYTEKCPFCCVSHALNDKRIINIHSSFLHVCQSPSALVRSSFCSGDSCFGNWILNAITRSPRVDLLLVNGTPSPLTILV